MEPKQASDTIKQEAYQLMQMIRGFRKRKSSDFENKDLLNWLCIALQQQADFKLSIANLLTDISKVYPDFHLDAVATESVYKPSEQVERTMNVQAPPFDQSFWMGLGDL